jgi:hypothetical protein
MKTTEQIKTEVVNYLTRTSQHLFTDTKGSFYKVFVDGDNFIVIKDDKTTVYDINKYIQWYAQHTECVVKHLLFLIPSYSYVGSLKDNNTNKLKSIPYFKAMREKHTEILAEMKKQTAK